MKKSYIIVINRNETTKVNCEDVFFIEQEKRKIMLHTADTEYVYYSKMGSVKEDLDNRFFLCTRSCIINMDRVVSMKDLSVIFENGEVVYLSPATFRKARQGYANYMLNLKRACTNNGKSDGNSDANSEKTLANTSDL